MANDDPVVQYYDADGKHVSEPVAGGRQYLSDDPIRPDGPKYAAPKVFGLPAQPIEKAQAAPPATKARKSSANK